MKKVSAEDIVMFVGFWILLLAGIVLLEWAVLEHFEYMSNLEKKVSFYEHCIGISQYSNIIATVHDGAVFPVSISCYNSNGKIMSSRSFDQFTSLTNRIREKVEEGIK